MVLIVLYVSLLETLQDEEIVIEASQILLLPECSVGVSPLLVTMMLQDHIDSGN